jgi:hypothetical protein
VRRAGREQEQRRGETEAEHGQPARVEPLERKLRQRHGEAPEHPRRDERGERPTAITHVDVAAEVHALSVGHFAGFSTWI